MKVAFILGSFPTVSETFILNQITGLIDLGHEVDIYSEERPNTQGPVHADVGKYNLLSRTVYVKDSIPDASGYWEMPVWPVDGETWLPEASNPISNQVRIAEAAPVMIECLRKSPQIFLRLLDVDEYGEQAKSLSAIYRLNVIMKHAKDYDVVHAHFGPIAKSFRFVKELLNVPFIVSFHGYDNTMIPKNYGCTYYDRLFPIADLVTVNSQYSRQSLESLGCPPEKIYQYNYGIDVDKITFRVREYSSEIPVRLLTVGRLVEKKGMEYCIRALAGVKKTNTAFHYDIIGEGPLRPVIEELVTSYGLEGHISLRGAQDAEHVRRFMDEADIFLLTSVTAENGDQEGTPVSLLEAQASGLPVISTIHSGIPEIVLDGVTGLLVPERDEKALESRITYLLNNPECWSEFGRNGRKHIEQKYNLKKLNAELQCIYERAIV